MNQLQWQLERKILHSSNPKSCLKVLKTPFKEFFDLKEVNALEFHNKCWQKNFKDYTGLEPQTYRRILLRYLDELDKLIDERVLKYDELRMEEKEVQAIKEIEKRLKENEKQRQESLVSASTTLEACLVTEEMDDNLVAKESTYDSVTSSEQLDESSSSHESSNSRNEIRSSDKESSSSGNDVDADIEPTYDSDTVTVTPPKITTHRNTTLGCYFIVHTHELKETTSKETFIK
ncbi:hypothetical protein Tco_1037847 [Tanacetum coccineum]